MIKFQFVPEIWGVKIHCLSAHHNWFIVVTRWRPTDVFFFNIISACWIQAIELPTKTTQCKFHSLSATTNWCIYISNVAALEEKIKNLEMWSKWSEICGTFSQTSDVLNKREAASERQRKTVFCFFFPDALLLTYTAATHAAALRLRPNILWLIIYCLLD